MRFERRAEAALVGLQDGQAALAQDVGRCLVHGDDDPQRLAVRRSADRDDEEVLEVELAARVQAAAQDVHHRQR